MNYKRAAGIGILIYFVTLLIGGIASAALGIKMEDMSAIPMEMWMISACIAVALSLGGAYWYFMGKGLKPSLQAGFQFGVTMVLIGFILDILMFLPLATQGKNPLSELGVYYSQPAFWLTLALILAGSSAMGMWLEKKGKR